MSFPDVRMRDRRKDEQTRAKYRQTPDLSLKGLIMPMFIKEGIKAKSEIKPMPGIYQFPLDEAVDEAGAIYKEGLGSVILFGIPGRKDEIGSSSYDDNGIVQKAIRRIKADYPALAVIADVCMCEYTSHGHCGIIKENPSPSPLPKGERGRVRGVDNDATIEILAKIAVSYAKAGADIVAPSAMMDGQVKAIKSALIENNYPKVKIMPYSAKYASNFYGPFRDAVESQPQFGDRKAYQMDFHNSDEALLEAKLDIEEGADILMVKPALGYQDIIYRLKKELAFPLACYSVSGEYSMVKNYCRASGNQDIRVSELEKNLVLEMLTGYKRAGADFIITYYAKEAAKWLKKK